MIRLQLVIALCLLGNVKCGGGFTTTLYQHVVGQDTGKNLIISPLSIQTALTLAYTAAGGKTAQEMQIGLDLSPGDKTKVAEESQKLIKDINDGSLLTLVNKIYVKNTYPVRMEFSVGAQRNFGSEVTNIDFSNKMRAAQEINDFVASKTQNKLLNFIDPAIIDRDTRMMLINTIYLKGVWNKPFDEKDTKPRPFYITNHDSVDVNTMTVRGFFAFNQIASLDAKVVELPLKDSDISVYILLPNKRSGLVDLEKQLGIADFANIKMQLRKTQVYVQMPKFKFESSFDLKKTLSNMGMATMFSNNADFKYITTSTEYLKIGDVIHKAVIDFNEDGVEVASGTAVRLTLLTAVLGQQYMVADHPFMFAIVKGDTVVFTGRYVGPNSSVQQRTEPNQQQFPQNQYNPGIMANVARPEQETKYGQQPQGSLPQDYPAPEEEQVQQISEKPPKSAGFRTADVTSFCMISFILVLFGLLPYR